MLRTDTSVLNADYWTDLFEGIGQGWNRFWFTPASPLPLAFVRIGTGLVMLLYLLSYNSDLTRWFASNGILTPSVVTALHDLTHDTPTTFHLSPLNAITDSGQLWVFQAFALIVTIAFTLGAFTRVTGLLTLLVLLSLVHRAPLITRQVEPILSFMLLYLCIGPAGARLSVDRWLSRRFGWRVAGDYSTLANISLRLLQVHAALFYVMLGMTMLYGDSWWTGVAVWNLLAQTHSRPVDLSFMQKSPYLVNAWTHVILAYELLFPVLIWNRLARPLLLAVGVFVWVSLALATGMLPYCLAMLVLNRAFIPAERYQRWLKSDSPSAALTA